MEPVSLHAGGFLLRPWDGGERDRRAAAEAFADPEFRRWNTLNAPSPDEEGVRDFMKRAMESWQVETHAFWAITDPAAEGEVIGSVSVGSFDWRMRTARVSYWLRSEARGRGAATRALHAVTDWSFRELGLHRLELGHAAKNAPSCRVAERCGYLAEGLLRDAMIGTDGETWHDVHLHSRLATDRAQGA